jgi:hypothetical protein
LQYDLEHLEALTPPDAAIPRAYDLVSESAGFFDEEGVKESILQGTVESLLSGKCMWHRTMADEAAEQGRVWLEGAFAYLILRLKGELGLGGDPFLEGLTIYGKIIKQEV